MALSQNFNEIIVLLIKKKESKTRITKVEPASLCALSAIYISVYNHLKISFHILLLKILLIISSECIKHVAKYQIIFF